MAGFWGGKGKGKRKGKGNGREKKGQKGGWEQREEKGGGKGKGEKEKERGEFRAVVIFPPGKTPGELMGEEKTAQTEDSRQHSRTR